MEGAGKHPKLHTPIRWAGLSLALLLLCASALSAVSSDEARIWIAHARGVLVVTQADGHALSEIRLTHEARASAVDAQRDRLWVFSDKAVLGFDSTGTRKFSTKINPPNGQPEFLTLDVRDGSAWLAVHAQLYRFDASGTLLGDWRLPQPISGMTLDLANGRLWIAYQDAIETYDAGSGKAFGVDTRGAKKLRALDYDRKLNQIWVVADDSLRRYSPDGELLSERQNPWLDGTTAIAADHHGGVWVADTRRLAHFDQSGLIDFIREPFAGQQPAAIVDLLADPDDGSAWIASQRRVGHYARDGMRINEFTPEPDQEESTRLLLRQLALETPSPAPRIRIVSPTDGDSLATAYPAIILSVEGTEPDLDSMEFRLNGEVRQFHCMPVDQVHRCAPVQAVHDGAYLLTATLADNAGNRSQPAELRFTIDTTAPEIEITHPKNGLLTNQGSVSIAGHINETASLTINDVLKSVQPDGAFSHGPFELSEGENIFQLRATDAAGNMGERVLRVMRDSIPPPPPNSDQIQAQQQTDGSVRVSGATGSVEGGTTVTVVNTRTGERVTTVANPDGSFSTTIAGENGDQLQIYATDRAGNVGPISTIVAASDGPFSGPIRFGSTAPGDGTVVDGDYVLILVELDAPPNTGVTMNEVVAAKVSGTSQQRYYAQIPLQLGENAVEIKAHGQDGRTVTQTHRIISTGPFPYRIALDRPAGASPLETQIEVFDVSGLGIQQIRVDLDNNGTIDRVIDDGQTFTASYTGVGIRQSRVVVYDDAGSPHSQSFAVLLLDLAAIDQDIQAVWTAMLDALAAGDKESAMQYLSNGAKEQYGPIFDALLPKMPEIVSTYSAPRRSLVARSYAEYGVNRSINGTNSVFLIGFVRNELGQWQLETM